MIKSGRYERKESKKGIKNDYKLRITNYELSSRPLAGGDSWDGKRLLPEVGMSILDLNKNSIEPEAASALISLGKRAFGWGDAKSSCKLPILLKGNQIPSVAPFNFARYLILPGTF